MAAKDAPKWESDTYWSAQDFQQSARLHMQHWIWQYQLGYILNPKIKLPDSGSLKIADIGAGNAAWLLELSTLFPSSSNVELTGFDITSNNFPHPSNLPSNLHLQTWDAFSSVPEEHRGKYDLVHLRLLNSTIIDNKAEGLIDNALAMLKPGGYLWWDENDPSRLQFHVPESAGEAKASKTMTTLFLMMTKGHSKILTDWLYALPQTLREQGCEVLEEGTVEAKPALRKACTDNYLTVWKDTIRMFPETPMPLPPGMGLPESLSFQSYAELLKDVVDETSKGVSFTMPFYVTVARKGS